VFIKNLTPTPLLTKERGFYLLTKINKIVMNYIGILTQKPFDKLRVKEKP